MLKNANIPAYRFTSTTMDNVLITAGIPTLLVVATGIAYMAIKQCEIYTELCGKIIGGLFILFILYICWITANDLVVSKIESSMYKENIEFDLSSYSYSYIFYFFSIIIFSLLVGYLTLMHYISTKIMQKEKEKQ